MADILEFLKSLQPAPYANNLPSGGPAPAYNANPAPAITKADVEAQAASDSAAGALGPDPFAYREPAQDSTERPYLGQGRLGLRGSVEKKRAEIQADLEKRKYPGQNMVEGLAARFAGTTPGSPEFFSRITGENDMNMPPAPPPGPIANAQIPGEFAAPPQGTALPPRPKRQIPRSRPPQGALTEDAATEQPAGPGALTSVAETGGGALGDRPIDMSRPTLDNADGTFSTERTITIEAGGKHFLIPTIVNGKQLDADSAVAMWKQGKNPEVGVYGSAQEAERAAQERSKRIGDVRGPQGALATPAPIETKSLSAEYAKRVAEIEKDSGRKLTDDQKDQLKLDFFLRLMAAGGRPGAQAIASAGEAGLGTEALAGQMTHQNIALAKEQRREALDTAYRGVGFMDKEQDNARIERHFQAMDARDRERLKLTAQQIADGKWTELKNGKSGTYVLYNKQTGETKDTGIAIEKAGDKTPAEVQLIDRAMRDPAFLKTLVALRSTGKERNDSDQIVELAGKFVNDPMNPRSPQDALATAREIVDGAKGQATGEKIERPTTKAQFDALPKGVKFVNPKDGKTYTKS